MNLIGTIGGVIEAIALLVPILFILLLTHELAHFLTARLFSISVAEFGFGYPPKARTLFRRGGVEYTLNWLPFGAFVRMSDDAADLNAYENKPAWQRFIVMASGALVNLLIAVVVFAAIALVSGSDVPQYKVGISYVVSDGPAAAAGLQAGDTLISINNRTVTSNADVQEEAVLNAGKSINLLLNRNGQELSLSVTPRQPQGNQGTLGVGLLPLYNGLKVQNVVVGSSSYRAGLREGDSIIAVDGADVLDQPVSNTLALANALSGKQQVTVTVRRGNNTQLISAVPVSSIGSSAARDFADFSIMVPYTHLSYGLVDALGQGVSRTGAAAGEIVETLKALFQGSVPVTDLSGPVGIGALANQVAQQDGFIGLLGLVGFLSVNLFFINLLPLPALDGGRCLFIAIEILMLPFGRRIPLRMEERIHALGYIAMLLLALLITISDIGRLLA